MKIKIIQSGSVEELETEVNTYLESHDCLLKQVEIRPRGNSQNQLCYAVLVEVEKPE